MRVLVYLSLHCSRRWGSWFLLLFLLDSPEKEKLFPTVKKEKDRLLLESHISQAVEGLPQCSPRLWQSLHATVSAMIQMVPPLMGSPSVSSTAPSTSQNDSVTVSVTVSLISVVSFDSVAAPISVAMLFLNHPKLTCFLHFNLNTQIQSEDICIFATIHTISINLQQPPTVPILSLDCWQLSKQNPRRKIPSTKSSSSEHRGTSLKMRVVLSCVCCWYFTSSLYSDCFTLHWFWWWRELGVYYRLLIIECKDQQGLGWAQTCVKRV